MFLGVGLGKAVGLAMFTMVFIIVAKTIVNKYQIEGLTEVVNAV